MDHRMTHGHWDCRRSSAARPPMQHQNQEAGQTLVAHIRWNPVKKQLVVDLELNISKRFVSGVLRSDLGLKAYQQSTGHFLILHLKEHRAIKSKCLLHRYANRGEFLFIDENIFNIEEGFQSENWPSSGLNISRNLWQGSKHPERPSSCLSHDLVGTVVWCHHPAPFVWKTSANVYENTVSEPVVKPLNNALFSNDHWSFKQDLAPTRKANSTKVLLWGTFRNSLLWVILGYWPFSSSGLNPMDSKSGQCLKA